MKDALDRANEHIDMLSARVEKLELEAAAMSNAYHEVVKKYKDQSTELADLYKGAWTHG